MIHEAVSSIHRVPFHISRSMALRLLDFFRSIIPRFLAVLTFSPLASCATITQLAQSSSDPAPQRTCVRQRDWAGNGGYVASDCQQAIRRLIHEEVFQHGDQEFEFIAPNAAPIHTLPIMRTPRRYGVGESPLQPLDRDSLLTPSNI